MGNTAVSQQNQQLHRFFSRFEVIDQDHQRNLLRMQEVNTNRYFTLRLITTNDEIQKRNIEYLIRVKFDKSSKFIWRLQEYVVEKQKNYCSNQFKAYLLFQTPYKDLKQQILERRMKKAQFQEQEVLQIIINVAMGLKYLSIINQPHESVCSSNIYIDRSGSVMLSDPWLNPQNSIYPSTNHIYLSPEKLDFINNNRHQKVDWLPNDLFALGMVVLETVHMQFMDDVYQRNSKEINSTLLKAKVETIKWQKIKKYVQRLIGFPQDRINLIYEIESNEMNNAKYQEFRPKIISVNPNERKKPIVLGRSEHQKVHSKLLDNTTLDLTSNRHTVIQEIKRNTVVIENKNTTGSQPPISLQTIGAINCNIPVNNKQQPVRRQFSNLQNRSMYPIKIKYLNFDDHGLGAQNNRSIDIFSNPIKNLKLPLYYNQVKTNIIESDFTKKSQIPIISANKQVEIKKQQSTQQNYILNNHSEIIGTDSKSSEQIKQQILAIDKEGQKQTPTFQSKNDKIQSSNQINSLKQVNLQVEKNQASTEIKKESYPIQEPVSILVSPPKNRQPKTFDEYINYTIQQVAQSPTSVIQEDMEYVIQQYEAGSKYQGYKKNNARNGHGIFYYQDGGHYDGDWKDNKMHGFGKLYYHNLSLAYEGYWFMDEFHGYGKVYNDNPMPLNQPFNYFDFENLEEYWIYYEGNLAKDLKEGPGKIKISNGQIFSGMFVQDRIQGTGKYTTMSGQIVKGVWKNSKLMKILQF